MLIGGIIFSFCAFVVALCGLLYLFNQVDLAHLKVFG